MLTVVIDEALLADLRPLRRSEYDKLVDTGALEGQPIELIQGVLVEMAPQGPVHTEIVSRLLRLCAPLYAVGFTLRVQGPLAVGLTSEPEPDFAVVEDKDYSKAHAQTAFLVVEVAVTSQTRDLIVKPRLYAAAGVPEYWVVDVAAGEVVVHLGPREDGYRDVRAALPGETLHPVALPQLPGGIGVSELLP